MVEPIDQSIVTDPACSNSKYSTRQKKLGPAPFASFEDLSDDACPSFQTESNRPLQRMPEIEEDARSPESENNLLVSGRCSIGGTSNTAIYPSSGPTSGLQTPSTPRIDISCASSGTPQSESSSEKELFQCSLGLAFHEDGADDLRSSTEELELGPDDNEKSKKDKAETIRRASHPANLFHQGKISVSPDLDEQVRKLSTHSMCLDQFYSRAVRHSSFGAADCSRPGAHSSLSVHSNVSGRRSASPHKMLFETSFCGSKPIPTPSMDLGDSPPSSKQDKTLRDQCLTKQDSDSSLSQAEMLTETTIQVHHFTQKKPPTPNLSASHSKTSIRASTIPASLEQFSSEPSIERRASYSKSNQVPGLHKADSIDSNAEGRAVQNQDTSSHNLIKDMGDMRLNCNSSRTGIDADAPIETKSLFLAESQEQDDDEELPYIPTTLPLEKSAFVSMMPVKQRKFDASMTTNPIQRPRCINPPNLASLNDYIVHTTSILEVSTEDKKMKINLPREDSVSEIPVNNPKSPKKKAGPTSWTDFAELGLRSPREIRRKMKEENGTYNSDPCDGSNAGANNFVVGDAESLQAA